MHLFHDKLLSIAREVKFRSGERLLRQGETARGAFLIGLGEVEARVAVPGGGALSVASLGKGDVFGETALMERGVCMASVVAKSDVAGWFVEREDFRAAVAGRDSASLEIQKWLTRVLARKLRAANALLREHQAAEARPARPAQAQARSAPSFEYQPFLPLLAFFEGFDPHEIAALTEGCTVFELPRGAALFQAEAPAESAYLVVRGAVEVVLPQGTLERRITIAGPGELVGYLAALERRPHWASARIRESACLIELAAAQLLSHYEGASGTSLSLQRAIHRSLVQALARTNAQLIRLISHARLNAAQSEAEDLEKALRGQIILNPAA